jgi:dTDP-glucose 4,6-dehydratase
VVEGFLLNTDWELIGLDRLTYAANGFNRMRDAGVLDNPRLKLYTANFSEPMSEGLEKEIGQVDYILHMGAETHVDNSIRNPEPFVQANVVGTMNMLQYARRQEHLKRFFYFSTDEVFGPAGSGVRYAEWDRYNSGNPYAATKAAGEELCLAWANTYKVPVVVTHTMNCVAERQHPEKFVPSTIRKVLAGEMVTIHADPTLTKPGSRFYIHCRNVAAALLFLMEQSEVREKYNIVGEREIDNLWLAKFIAKVIGKPLKYEMVSWHAQRPGHDLRYALSGKKMHAMGWRIPKTFEESLTKTIEWYLQPENEKWLTWDTPASFHIKQLVA